MSEKSLMIDLEDPRSERIGEVISNKTAKKILNSLIEKEKSPSEIASALNLPLNTVTYNLENLIQSGLIEKTKKSLWSVKGKKIEYYKISNKKIIIMPKKLFSGILPSLLITLSIALVLMTLNIGEKYSSPSSPAPVEYVESASIASDQKISQDAPQQIAEEQIQYSEISKLNTWAWFLMGAWFSLLILVLWNWRKE